MNDKLEKCWGDRQNRELAENLNKYIRKSFCKFFVHFVEASKFSCKGIAMFFEIFVHFGIHLTQLNVY